MGKIGFLIALFLLVSCDGSRLKFIKLPSVPQEKLAETGFEEIRAQVLIPNCVRCHGWVRNHKAVTARAGAIRRSVLTGRMPKNRSMPLEQRALLVRWLEIGAPVKPPGRKVDPTEPPPVIVPPPTAPAELNYELLRQRVFEPYCLGCHEFAEVENDFTTLNTYADIVSQLPKITQMVESGKMPPLEKEADPLPDEEKKLLLQWILDGAPETMSKKGDHP
ncbi:MAG: hypothetical protein AB7N80_09155 [Bdellovibrionales bacterium]